MPSQSKPGKSSVEREPQGKLQPVSSVFGLDRGQPVDRYYIEQFLKQHSHAIHGHVLEAGDATYTRRFGGQRVTRSDVLNAQPGNRATTIVGDLTSVGVLPDAAFDCIVLTQTLHCIYDLNAALANLHRALLPGGILLATLPGISQISRFDMDRWGDYWRFTTLSARRLFEEFFDAGNLNIESWGSVSTAVAFLQGNAAEELDRSQLDYHDPNYELLITVAAVKEGDTR